MTTHVVVKTHDWPVSVVALDKHSDGGIAATTLPPIPPHSGRDMAVTDSRSLIITEMALPAPPSDL